MTEDSENLVITYAAIFMAEDSNIRSVKGTWVA